MKKFLLATLLTVIILASLSVAYFSFSTPAAADQVAFGPSGNAGVPGCQCDDWNRYKFK